jgi:hypothetical protein
MNVRLSTCYIFETTEQISIKFDIRGLFQNCLTNLILVHIGLVESLLHLKLISETTYFHSNSSL